LNVVDPCDPGWEPVEDTPPDPCMEAQPFTQATTLLGNNPVYTTAKAEIENKILSNPNIEYGVVFGKDANNVYSASNIVSGDPQTNMFNLPTTWPGAFADLHYHYNYFPPSPGDLYNLIRVGNRYPGYNTRVVRTSDGSVYALVVTNAVLADQFSLDYPAVSSGNGPNFPNTIANTFYDVQDFLRLNYTPPAIAEEMALAYTIDFYKMGMILTKQSPDGTFKRLITKKMITHNNIVYYANNCP